ncbi:MAG: hypothetical protein Kow0092_08600 [Deferrisomatales bacterium]
MGSYEASFVLEVLEWGGAGAALWRFPCREGFARRDGGGAGPDGPTDGVGEVHREVAFRVRAALLDHQVPSLAYALEEPVHVNVARDALDRLGLAPGPWVRTLKEAVQRGAPGQTPIPLPDGRLAPLEVLVGEGVVRASEGQKLAYVADCVWEEPGIARAVTLCRAAHVLYCEAAFLEEDADRARDRFHLTAAQAGELARRAGVGELRVFHFSPKYRGREEEVLGEAAEAFGGPVALGP